jgi:tRNA uridine 5-carbamoylmethylation protein Kti12
LLSSDELRQYKHISPASISSPFTTMPSIVIAGHPCVGKTSFAHLLAKRALSRPSISNVVHISESTACPDQTKAECYSNSHMEKTTRAALKSEFDRAVISSAANNEEGSTLVILDSLNYIKGYRYELYCISKAAGERHGVVWVMGSSSDEQFNSASAVSQSDALAKKRNQERKEMQKQLGQQDDDEKKRKSNNDLDGYYEDDETMNQLVLRFEPPSEKNRWENPLFKVDVTSVSPWNRNGTLDASVCCDQTTMTMKALDINDKPESNSSSVVAEATVPQPVKKKVGSSFKRNKKLSTAGNKTASVAGTAPLDDKVKLSSVEPVAQQSVPSSIAKRNLAIASAQDDNAAGTSGAKQVNQTMEEVIDGILDSFFSQRALTEGMSTLHQFSAESNALNQVDNITHRVNSEILKAQKATSLSAGVGGKIFVPLTPDGDRRPINLSKPLYPNELRNFRRQFLKWIAAHPLADGTKEDKIADVYISYVESQI